MWLGKGVRAYVADYHNIRHGLISSSAPGSSSSSPASGSQTISQSSSRPLTGIPKVPPGERTLTALPAPGIFAEGLDGILNAAEKIPAASLLQTV